MHALEEVLVNAIHFKTIKELIDYKSPVPIFRSFYFYTLNLTDYQTFINVTWLTLILKLDIEIFSYWKWFSKPTKIFRNSPIRNSFSILQLHFDPP